MKMHKSSARYEFVELICEALGKEKLRNTDDLLEIYYILNKVAEWATAYI